MGDSCRELPSQSANPSTREAWKLPQKLPTKLEFEVLPKIDLGPLCKNHHDSSVVSLKAVELNASLRPLAKNGLWLKNWCQLTIDLRNILDMESQN